MITALALVDDFGARREFLQQRVDFLLHGGHNSNGHRDSLAV